MLTLKLPENNQERKEVPINLENLVKYRPCLYHLTGQQNLASIRLDRQLRCANRLLNDAKLEHLAWQRRLEHVVIDSENGRLLIRDQRPLAAVPDRRRVRVLHRAALRARRPGDGADALRVHKPQGQALARPGQGRAWLGAQHHPARVRRAPA